MACHRLDDLRHVSLAVKMRHSAVGHGKYLYDEHHFSAFLAPIDVVVLLSTRIGSQQPVIASMSKSKNIFAILRSSVCLAFLFLSKFIFIRIPLILIKNL